jgi:hypothetical protein
VGTERKERVLHARIPVALEDQIKRLAEALRVPVSNLVRNMLEDAIEVTRRVSGITPAPSTIYGWQELVLNLDVSCDRCGKALAAGDRAFVGMSTHARDPKHFICSACLPGNKGDSHGRQA